MSNDKGPVIREGYLVKYALSDGIEKVDFKPTSFVGRVILHGEKWRWAGFFTLGKDVFSTAHAAQEAAEAMRKRKIASLKKQLAKMEAMAFEVPK